MLKDKLLTKKEVQEYLRISRATLEQKVMKEIPYIKLGKKVLFKKSVIDEYLEKKTVNK